MLPLNPQGLDAVPPELAFNTAVSFTTNTNWQFYAGETTMSYFTQMAALAFHNWVSAAAGIAIAVALTRGLARRSGRTIGNFWVDLGRCTFYVLLPICQEIGGQLLISPKTVEYHLHKAFTKLGIKSRHQLERVLRRG